MVLAGGLSQVSAEGMNNSYQYNGNGNWNQNNNWDKNHNKNGKKWNHYWNNWNWHNNNQSAPNNCKVWYDGCNTCSRQYPGGPLVCTKLACFAQGQSYCKDYFNNNGGWNNNNWNSYNNWGWPYYNFNWNGYGWW